MKIKPNVKFKSPLIIPDTWLDASSSSDITLGGAASLVDIPSWTVSSGLVAEDPDGDWYQFRMSVDESPIIHTITSSYTNDTTGMIKWQVDLKAGEMITGATEFYVGMYNTTNSNAYQIFDLTNGILGTTGAGAIDGSIEPLDGGGYRCSYISPANLSTSGVRIYFLKTNALATLKGDGVGTFYIKNNVVSQQRISGWNSKGSSANKIDFVQATAANQPIIVSNYSTNKVNNVNCPIWQMDNTGSNAKFLQNATKSLYKFLHDGTGSSVFILYKHLDSTDGSTQFLMTSCGVGAQVGWTLYKSPDDSLSWRVQDETGSVITVPTTPTLVNGNVYLISLRFNNSVFDMRLNGTSIGSGVPIRSASTADSGLNLTIGRAATTNTAFRFCVRDVLMYKSYLDDGIVQNIEQVLANRGGITL